MAALPSEITSQIARIAVEIARLKAPKNTGDGAAALSPVWSEGYIGISGPDYMMIQDKGFEKFDMVGLAGKVVPIRTPSGKVIFRYVHPDNIGVPRLVVREGMGGLVKPAWQHPGLAPKNFIEDSIREAIDRWTATTTLTTVLSILGRTEYRILTDELAIGVTGVAY